MDEFIEIPFGANDSELKGWEYTIPEDMEAVIEDGKIIVRPKENKNEKIRQAILAEYKERLEFESLAYKNPACNKDRVSFLKKAIEWLEKQKDRGPLTKEEEYTLQRIIEQLEDESCPQSWKDLLYDIYNLPYGKQKDQKLGDWNPTKEQKKALWNAIIYIQHHTQYDSISRFGSINGMNYPDILKLLKSIYEGIKNK